MTDRELLELAAKAAGYKTDHPMNALRLMLDPPVAALCIPGVQTAWNPLENDGDALRLAVRLRINIDHNHAADQQRWVAADCNGCEGCYAPVSCVEDDFEESERATATRRAIVRAAAEIGR